MKMTKDRVLTIKTFTTMYKNFSKLSAVVKAIKRNTFGVVIVVETIPTMRKTNNPFLGRVSKVSTYTNVALGRDYENAVNNVGERTDANTTRTFKADAPKGQTWSDYPYFLQSIKDSEQFYLRMTMNKNTKIDSVFYLDGRLATDTEVADIKFFISSSNGSAKQADYGIKEEDFVRPISVKVENIISVQQGTISFNR